jgi:protein arginine kinase activator
MSYMTCDLCDKPAVVHEVTVKNGVKSEVHLCEEHADAAGIDLAGHQPHSQMLTKFVICKEERRSPASRRTCRACGTSFRTFRHTGVLGCPLCYDTFSEHLGPMIERAQNGGTSHGGKCPRRGGASIDRQLRVQRLFQELEAAVAAEQYERAAELRDQLRELQPEARTPGRPGMAGVPNPPGAPA